MSGIDRGAVERWQRHLALTAVRRSWAWRVALTARAGIGPLDERPHTTDFYGLVFRERDTLHACRVRGPSGECCASERAARPLCTSYVPFNA